jgi:spore maturation protein CgeB
VAKPRILLTGPDWFGGLLEFCEHGLQDLGAEVRVAPTRVHPRHYPHFWWKGRFSQFPVVGWRVHQRMSDRLKAMEHDRTRAAFRQTLVGWRPDLVVSLLNWGEWILKDVIDEVRGIPRAGWLMDDPFQVDHELASLLPAFDRLYTIDESWAAPVELLTGKPVSELVCGADLRTQRPVPAEDVSEQFRGGVAFVGSSYTGDSAGALRRALLRPLAGLGLRLYGNNGWLHDPVLGPCYHGGPLEAQETNAVYNGADIVLNIHHPQFKAGTSLRTFGICAAEAFQLVDWRPGLERYFVLDEELVAFRTPEDLREKAARYLGDEAARRRIARAGYERVRREHSYAHRLAVILRDMDCLPSASERALAHSG